MVIVILGEFRELVVGTGAIASIIAAMKAFPLEKKLQEPGCWALSNLATNGKHKTKKCGNEQTHPLNI